MKDKGVAHMGVGRGKGEERVNDAVRSATESPLLETSISGARSILLNIAGGPDITMQDVQSVADQVTEAADKEAMVIFGASINDNMTDELMVTVIATGSDGKVGSILNSTISATGILGDKVSAKADTEEVQNEETLINPQTIGSGFGANLEDDYMIEIGRASCRERV